MDDNIVHAYGEIDYSFLSLFRFDLNLIGENLLGRYNIVFLDEIKGWSFHFEISSLTFFILHCKAEILNQEISLETIFHFDLSVSLVYCAEINLIFVESSIRTLEKKYTQTLTHWMDEKERKKKIDLNHPYLLWFVRIAVIFAK